MCQCLILDHSHVSSPRSPNRTCGFPASGSPVGSCCSHTARTCRQLRSLWVGLDALCDGSCTVPASSSAWPPIPRQACSRPDAPGPSRAASAAPPVRSLRFGMGCFRLRPALSGVLGCATPIPSLPSVIVPHLRPLRSTGITRLLRYYEPLRHPVGPSWPSRVPGWRVHATDRASRVAAVSLLRACHRQYPGGPDRCSRRSLPGRWQPSPYCRRVGFRITLFEACSTFTARCSLHAR